MIEQLQTHVARPMLNFIQHIGAVHALLVLFGVHTGGDEMDTEIAWESGDDEDQRLLPPAVH